MYKYKLIIKEEEDPVLKRNLTKNELTLTTKDPLTSDEILAILNDPKNLSGVFASKSTDFKDFETQVFGKPNIQSNILYNKEIYKNNGKPLYSKIAKAVGRGFQKDQFSIKNDKEGNLVYLFPNRTSHNIDLIKTYFSDHLNKTGVSSDLSPDKVDDNNIKFPLNDESSLKKILNNAGLTNKDYSLTKTEKPE